MLPLRYDAAAVAMLMLRLLRCRYYLRHINGLFFFDALMLLPALRRR